MPNNLKMTSEKIATAARMYERMATYEDISAAIGVSKTCVLEALKNMVLSHVAVATSRS